MIAAISIMRRRPDLTREAFNKHWLHPHGTMTAELPGTRYYVQHHFRPDLATNDVARSLEIDGIPELWYDDYEARARAYMSPRIAECNIDSEQFVGAVTRLVTEPKVVLRPRGDGELAAKALILSLGSPDAAWAETLEQRARKAPGLIGLTCHRILEQAAAPNSRIAELELPIAGLAEVTFDTEAALEAAAGILAGSGPDAIFGIRQFKLV